MCIYTHIKKEVCYPDTCIVGVFRDGVISSFWLSHSYEWPVLSPGYYKSLKVIVVSRLTDPSIPFVIMCEITCHCLSP